MVVLGAAAGYLALLVTRRLIRSRTEGLPEKSRNVIVSHKISPFVWYALFSAGFTIIYLAAGAPYAIAECAAVFTLCACIGAVDWVIRKIPNSLLLALISSRVAFLIIRGDFSDVKVSLLGFVVAAVIFAIPALFKLNVGAGDTKLAAVTGLYLGISGFLQAMIIMAVLITFYGIYLLISKQGGFRTKTAMGPYLALGFICTLVFPIVH
jgi:prepilin signal peptidase PulO-like enzyme (type II secretory pathway)